MRRAIEGTDLRTGMWVMKGKKLGILHYATYYGGSEDEFSQVEFHEVNEDGETLPLAQDFKAREITNYAGIRQASFDEIPAKRRPTKKLAKELGYVREE